jgi:opacity protein-like surface antigen
MKVFLFVLLLIPAQIHAQKRPAFLELGAFSGGLMKPSGQRVTGFGFGVGKNKNLVSVEGSREFLSNYELGIGSELNPASLVFRPGSYPVETSPPNSTVKNFGGNFRRDLMVRSHGRLTVYGLGGLSYVRSKSKSAIYAQPLVNVFPNDAAFLQSVYHASDTILIPVVSTVKTMGVALGGGVRIPVSRGIGIRAEIRTRWNKGADSQYSNPSVPIRDSNGNAIRLSNGFTYGIASRSNPGPRVNGDTFVGLSFGLYYRIFNRHV